MTDLQKFLDNLSEESGITKLAVVAFKDDDTTVYGYFNMDLRDKALAKHELEIDIIDQVVKINKDRYFQE